MISIMKEEKSKKFTSMMNMLNLSCQSLKKYIKKKKHVAYMVSPPINIYIKKY